MLKEYFADLHIHIGRTEAGEPVKISASRNLTFYNIAEEASHRKGMDMIGIIDCHSPGVLNDIERYIQTGEMSEIEGGGLAYQNTTILLGSEIEVYDEGMSGPAHLLAFLPNIEAMKQFSSWLSRHMTNIQLSSQRIYVPSRSLQAEVLAHDGLIIPAHIFTPHKGIYGAATTRMNTFMDVSHISAVELGLSADTFMGGHLSELNGLTFLSNSDAHSLAKIGREYNVLRLQKPNFTEFKKAMKRENGRGVAANYGLNPRLGKYHRTYCLNCEQILDGSEYLARESAATCPHCQGHRFVIGVMDRIEEITDQDPAVIPAHRPPYHYQVPLEFIPGLGRKTMEKLLDHFGTEMNILHKVSHKELAAVVGERIADYMEQARNGTLNIRAGGGGRYGKVT